MKLEVLKYPDAALRELSEPVDNFDAALSRFLDDLAETMYANNGVGLAAPQVGNRIRVFVIDVDQKDGLPGKLYEFINPKITKGEGSIVFEEGCLSVPGVSEEVTRKRKVQVQYWDRKGQFQVLEAEDLLAVAIQHENDHLDGILFLDRLSPLKRSLIKRKLSKVVL